MPVGFMPVANPPIGAHARPPAELREQVERGVAPHIRSPVRRTASGSPAPLLHVVDHLPRHHPANRASSTGGIWSTLSIDLGRT